MEDNKYQTDELVVEEDYSLDLPKLFNNYSIYSDSADNYVDSGGIYDSQNITQSYELPIDMQFNDGHVLSIAVYSVLFVFSAVGNLTVLIFLLRRRRIRQMFPTIDFMLLNLAIADLMVTFLMMPLEMVWAATVYWRAGDLVCRIMAFFRIFGLFLSSFVLVCLAIDRYMAVKFPMQVLGGEKRSRNMILVSWILSVLCSLPQAFVFHVERHPQFEWYTQCVIFSSFPSPEYELAYFLFGMFFMYLGPFIIIVVLYCGIVIELVRRHRECSHQLQDQNGADGLRRSGIGNLGRAKEKALKMTLLIAAIFFICWTPYYIISVWFHIDKESFQKMDPRIQKGLFLFACTNSTMNPIVYGVFHLKSGFRRNNHESVRQRFSGTSVRETSHSYVRSNTTRSIYNGNKALQVSSSLITKGMLANELSKNICNGSSNNIRPHVAQSASFV